MTDSELAGTTEEREALGFRAWPESTAQTYRAVYLTDSGGTKHVDVEARTGDEAAIKALAEIGGGKIVSIVPAPQKAAKK